MMTLTVNTHLLALEESCTLLPLIMKQLEAKCLHHHNPLLQGLPQSQQPLPPRVCNIAPWVQGTNSPSATGTPAVPLQFPTSPMLPLSPSLTTVGESHITPSFLTHIDHQSPNSLVFPTDIPFGDSIPSPKPNSSFWIGFCNIGGFPSHARNNPKVMEIKHFIVAHNLDLFGGCKANLNWCNLLDHIQLKNGFTWQTPAIPSPPIIFMRLSEVFNLVAHYGLGQATWQLILPPVLGHGNHLP